MHFLKNKCTWVGSVMPKSWWLTVTKVVFLFTSIMVYLQLCSSSLHFATQAVEVKFIWNINGHLDTEKRDLHQHRLFTFKKQLY